MENQQKFFSMQNRANMEGLDPLKKLFKIAVSQKMVTINCSLFFDGGSHRQF